MRVSRPLALAVTLSVAVLGVIAPTAAEGQVATVAGVTETGTSTSVSLVLAPRDPALLARLADDSSGTRSARLAELARALPDRAEHQEVAAVLARQGFTVTAQTTWTITATSDAGTVSDVFGTRPALPQQPTAKQFRAATGSLPDQPASLDGLVSAVYPTTGGPTVFEPQAAPTPLTGADVRNADTSAGVPASTGKHDAGMTIATLQFAEFDSDDLSVFAQQNGLPDPVANGHYQPVTVQDPGTTDGNQEVALDQEAILSTAPTATQRPYFAQPTNIGLIADLDAVLADARRNPHIAALSTSWGQCEALTGSSFITTQAEPLLQSLAAAGVTIFAASGDNGIYDCGSVKGDGSDDPTADVDFPASSPQVVATGGTLLTGNGKRNTGSNWNESAWSCTSAQSCEDTTNGTGGSGGGVSGSADGKSVRADKTHTVVGNFAGFAKPAYQDAVTSAPYAGVTKRMVPDIAADGDPNSGFLAIYTDHSRRGAPQVRAQVGGTSLATPLSAAQLVNTLGDAGHTTGVGDIHAELYRAYTATKGLPVTSPRKVFRDVTSGTNGAPANIVGTTDPSVSAASGYDTVSGLGGVLWPALTPYLLGSHPPTATAGLAKVRKGSTKRRTVVRFRWTAARGADPMALASASAVVRANGRVVFRSTAGHGPKALRIRPGRRLTAVVTATDVLGTKATRTVHLRVTRFRPKQKHRRR